MYIGFVVRFQYSENKFEASISGKNASATKNIFVKPTA
jgi:hypothetical protein